MIRRRRWRQRFDGEVEWRRRGVALWTWTLTRSMFALDVDVDSALVSCLCIIVARRMLRVICYVVFL